MSYSLEILWYDRQRYLPAVLAVMFEPPCWCRWKSASLLGTFSSGIDPHRQHDGRRLGGSAHVVSVDVGEPIPEPLGATELDVLPEVVETEPYIQMFNGWSKPHGGTENTVIIGSRLNANALKRRR